MSYLLNERKYSQLIATYVRGGIDSEHFVDSYLAQWKSDRDGQWQSVNSGQAVSKEEQALCEVLDNIMVACDSFSSDADVVGSLAADELLLKSASSRYRVGSKSALKLVACVQW